MCAYVCIVFVLAFIIYMHCTCINVCMYIFVHVCVVYYITVRV